MADEDEIEALVVAAAGQDEPAWQRLWAAIEPPLSKIIARPRFLNRLGQREDDRRNIVVQVMARLRADDFHRLRLYLEAREGNPRLRFLSWLRVVTKRVGIDYMRAHPDYLRRATGSEWIQFKTMPPDSQGPSDRPPMTDHGTAHELARRANGQLPVKQHQAVALWNRGFSYEDIAHRLGVRSPTDARRLVRAALARLRRLNKNNAKG